MWLELYLAGIILAALVLYALLGGADFGGGVWDLLATGPRARDQRRVIEDAIGPIWEANHVWLIAVIVLLFSCFPTAYATLSTALHLPLTLMLLGIVLRGSAFVFRTYDSARDEVFRAWSTLFAVSSVLAPFMLGICLGAATSGSITLGPDGKADPDPFVHWLAPYPLATGAFVVAVFAFLAAVYLTNETDDPELQDAFRTRAFWATGAVTVLAWLTFYLMGDGAPRLQDGLWRSWWAVPFQAITAALGVFLLRSLWLRRYTTARALAIVQVVFVIGGFGLAQFPLIVTPDISFHNASAHPAVLRVVALGMTGGLAILLPAYVYLFRIFKRSDAPDPAA